MKKIISCLMTIILTIQCLFISASVGFANKENNYSTCYTKFVFSDNSTEYGHSIIKDDCLMVDVQWLCDKLGLVYRRLDTSRINQLTKAWNEKTNYFLSQKNLNLKDIFDENIECFTVSKPDSDFSFIFHEGKSKATASSVYLGEYSVDLGTEVTPVTDKDGNVSCYVPLFVFCNIFNAAYKICTEPESNYIALYESDITVVDILHMQNNLSKYETHNCLVNAINDDVLTFLGMALGESIDNAIESALTLKWENGLDPTKDNYETLALQMCSSDKDEISSLADSMEMLNFTKDAYSTFYDELLKFTKESCTSGKLKTKMDIYKDAYKLMIKHDFKISLQHFEDYYRKYKRIKDISKTVEIADVFNTSVSTSFPLFFNSVALVAEMSSAQEEYIENMNVYLEYANKTFSDDELYGHNYIQKKLDLYKSSSGKTFEKMKNILCDDDMISSMSVPFAELLSLQLGSLSLTHFVTKWGLNAFSGGMYDFKDIYFNCLCSLKLQNTTEDVINSYFTDSKFDINTYRALEWTRLKSYYVANENELELYKQYYETLKSDANSNMTLILLYQLGFGKKDKYSDEELKEFEKKIGYSVIYDIDNAFEDYNMMIDAKLILDYESETINSDTEELAEYMAVLLSENDGTTPDNIEYCESFAKENNKWVLENNYALYQPVECKIVEAEEKTPVEGAEVTFVSDKGDSVVCTTAENGTVLGLDRKENLKGSLEENDPEKQDKPFDQYEHYEAFSQYEPNIETLIVESYLPLGTYSLKVTASGYESYEYAEKVEVKFDEICKLGEIKLKENEDYYQIALGMMDTWIMGRINNNKASAETVHYKFKSEEQNIGDDFSSLEDFVGYEIPQILVTEVTTDLFDYEEINTYLGEKVEKMCQINYRCALIDTEGNHSKDGCSDMMLKINGKWWYIPDWDVINIDYCDGGFEIPKYRYTEIEMHSDGTTFYILENGEKISEEEALNAVNVCYGYSVTKELDGTFTLMPISADEEAPKIKENIIYYGKWVEGTGVVKSRYTMELKFSDNKIEIDAAPLNGIYTFDVSEVSGNIYYLKNGKYRSNTYEENIDDGKVIVNDDGSFDITYSIGQDKFEEHFVLDDKSSDNINANNSSTSSPNNFITPGVVQTKEGSNLNLRKDPSINNDPIDSIENGKSLYIDLTKSVDGWYYVKGKAISGKEMIGYVSSEFVKLDENKNKQETNFVASSAESSSQLRNISTSSKTYSYNPSNVLETNNDTCWCEGSDGDGVGEYIKLSSENQGTVKEIIIKNGICTDSELFYKNNRVKACTIEFSDGTVINQTLSGEYDEQPCKIKLPEKITSDYIKITIDSVYSGTKYNDTCITEIIVK